MEDPGFIQDYFLAEQQAAVYFIISGAVILTTGVALASFYRKYFFTGLAIGLGILSVVEISVGVGIYFRSPDDKLRVEQWALETPDMIANEEIPRMEIVMDNFRTIRWVEIILSLAGFLTFLVFRKQSGIAGGIGLGLAIQSVIMLVMDRLAEERAEPYLERLREMLDSMI